MYCHRLTLKIFTFYLLNEFTRFYIFYVSEQKVSLSFYNSDNFL